MNPHLDFLLSSVYDGSLASEHLDDLRKSGLTDETIATHKFRTVPPGMLDQLLGFRAPKEVESAYLIPFPAPDGWLDQVKVRLFPDTEDVPGAEVAEQRDPYRYNGGRRKYLMRRRSVPRLYFPIPTMRRAVEGTEPLWLVEGMKKSLAVMQLGLPAVGLESAWGWHLKASSALLPDFAAVTLKGRVVELLPDADVQTNPEIMRAMRQLADALRAVGARPRLVRLPQEVPA